MKIIDLLNKIANGEELPATIKYQDNYYNLIRKYNEDWEEYEFGYKNLNGGYLNIWRDNVLNDEVEIIEEEKKIPEKLPYYSLEKIQKAKNKDEWREERISLLEKRVNDLHIKMNDLLDYLKTKENK